MRMRKLFLLALCASLVFSGVWASAQESTGKGTEQKQEEFDELEKELEAAEAAEAEEAVENEAVLAETMADYETRARRQAIETRERLLKNPLWEPTHEQAPTSWRFPSLQQIPNRQIRSAWE